MKVLLRNPNRQVEVPGPGTVREVLAGLGILPESVLVIRDGELLTREERLGGDDTIELRPVISGGSR